VTHYRTLHISCPVAKPIETESLVRDGGKEKDGGRKGRKGKERELQTLKWSILSRHGGTCL
jgi:hypothetical protein